MPTERPESDGTAEWNDTTMVLVEIRAGGATGIGYTYVTAGAAAVIRDLLEPCVVGADALGIPAIATRMLHAVRNHGRGGVIACAISAIDVALWDLKARLLELPLAVLLGAARRRVPVYASGGFTSSDFDALGREVESYVAAGHRRIKIKIGREPATDADRVHVLARAAGPGIELMADANGAYSRKQALVMAEELARYGIVYFEEPVSSDDLEGLRLVRDRAPMAIAAGEYGYDSMYHRQMLAAGAVDILQADATRCLGITGFLQADALCEAYATPLSSHTAPAIHIHVGAAARRLVHVEHFADHVRMEDILFDGVQTVVDGTIAFDPVRAGLGIELRPTEAKRFAA
jgi:L-alanine-DL-glutamate epimerase-like enolase superfamily enzyme